MGFMDKVKEQAAVATAMAKDTVQKGQAKLDATQAKVAADGVLRQLGLAVYLEQAGRGSDTSETQRQHLIELLGEYEAEYGELKAVDDTKT